MMDGRGVGDAQEVGDARGGIGGPGHAVEDGKAYRVPYATLKRLSISRIDQHDLVDPQHAARLQYRLMTLGAVIKAKVDFNRKEVWVIYNPVGAQNGKEQISREGIMKFLSDEGVRANPDLQCIEERDFDYYKEFYAQAYAPASIREAMPLGWTGEEWKSIKRQREAKGMVVSVRELLSGLLQSVQCNIETAKKKSMEYLKDML